MKKKNNALSLSFEPLDENFWEVATFFESVSINTFKSSYAHKNKRHSFPSTKKAAVGCDKDYSSINQKTNFAVKMSASSSRTKSLATGVRVSGPFR
jgi:hypothetical protein